MNKKILARIIHRLTIVLDFIMFCLCDRKQRTYADSVPFTLLYFSQPNLWKTDCGKLLSIFEQNVHQVHLIVLMCVNIVARDNEGVCLVDWVHKLKEWECNTRDRNCRPIAIHLQNVRAFGTILFGASKAQEQIFVLHSLS